MYYYCYLILSRNVEDKKTRKMMWDNFGSIHFEFLDEKLLYENIGKIIKNRQNNETITENKN